ncbi:uncharacterized protein YbcV (DUF1398 family) [Acinetobacter sp. BIGb0196]|jgi:hypothetical protein|nr:uncharacterized protein YbcV (DUF1398 family) [Acinetobacter guillouiae]MCW2252989.1 uncharacterized protein YbcV (DUF1398 family) [Acinetobacter sp. BIGb0204]NII35605.1 uncharacterized protein YbcV (DUF1398 family) [Acinetobacter sp. BIGb0196]
MYLKLLFFIGKYKKFIGINFNLWYKNMLNINVIYIILFVQDSNGNLVLV